jgi:hypothetical protein
MIRLNSCEFSYEFCRRIVAVSQTRSCARWRVDTFALLPTSATDVTSHLRQFVPAPPNARLNKTKDRFERG